MKDFSLLFAVATTSNENHRSCVIIPLDSCDMIIFPCLQLGTEEFLIGTCPFLFTVYVCTKMQALITDDEDDKTNSLCTWRLKKRMLFHQDSVIASWYNERKQAIEDKEYDNKQGAKNLIIWLGFSNQKEENEKYWFNKAKAIMSKRLKARIYVWDY